MLDFVSPYCEAHAPDTKGVRAIPAEERAHPVTVICYAPDENTATTLAAHAGYRAGKATIYVPVVTMVENYTKARP
jgi:hypothetical protein